MAEFTDLSVLTGFTKDLWSKLKNVFPPAAKLVEAAPFDTADELGGYFKQGIVVQEESGFTHAAPSAGAFAVNAGRSMVTQEVKLQGYQTILQGSIDYESASRASSSRKAYAEIVGKKLSVMREAALKRLECECWYGWEGLGTIASSTAASNGKVTVTLTAATHAPLVWAGKVGYQVEVYGTTARVTSVTGPFTITAVNVADATRTLEIEETVSGDAADLKTWVDANPDAGDLFWASTVSGGTINFTTGANINTTVGLSYISGLTSGALWGITDIASYDVIIPNQHAVGGALSLSKILDGLSILSSRGWEGDIDVYLHPRAWTNMASDASMLRNYGAQDTKLKNGARALEVMYQGGNATIHSYGMVKAGNYFAFPSGLAKRVGSQDISFKRPGNHQGPGENIFWDDPSKAGYSYRLYGNQSFFFEEPGRLLKGTGVVNN